MIKNGHVPFSLISCQSESLVVKNRKLAWSAVWTVYPHFSNPYIINKAKFHKTVDKTRLTKICRKTDLKVWVMTILWPVADTTKQLILILEILSEFQFYFKSEFFLMWIFLFMNYVFKVAFECWDG